MPCVISANEQAKAHASNRRAYNIKLSKYPRLDHIACVSHRWHAAAICVAIPLARPRNCHDQANGDTLHYSQIAFSSLIRNDRCSNQHITEQLRGSHVLTSRVEPRTHPHMLHNETARTKNITARNDGELRSHRSHHRNLREHTPLADSNTRAVETAGSVPPTTRPYLAVHDRTAGFVTPCTAAPHTMTWPHHCL